MRQPDNQYAQVRFGITPPYGLLSSLESLAGIISGSTSFSLAAPAGPANVGLASQYVAIGDFKGDGSPGVAYIDVARNRNKVSVYLGSPAFAFSNSASYTVGAEVAGVIAADFNQDGKTDLAVAYGGGAAAGGISILLNNGNGTSAPAVNYVAGASPISVAALDLNHDGILDLAVADHGPGSPGKVFVLLGRAGGTFGPGVFYPAGQNPLSVTIADFNGDGNPDLAVTAADNTLSILLGNAAGTFHAGPSRGTGHEPRYVAAGDFNRDGKMDLAVANALDQTVSIFLGQGNGSFQAGNSYCTSYYPESLIVTDYNGDGNLDIIQGAGDARGLGPGIESENIDILPGNGDGTFRGAISIPVAGSSITGTFLATGDFNGDGKLDAILNDKFGDILYLAAGAGGGNFQAPVALPSLAAGGNQTGPSGAVVGDFNGDGRLDLAVTEAFAGRVAVLLNSAAGLQLSGAFASGGAVPGPIAAADFNGDGRLDLAVVNAPPDDRTTPGNLTVFFGGGNGAFQLNHTYSAGSLPTAVAVADLNGDGKPDLVVTDESDPFVEPRVAGAVYVFLNDGHGGFGTPLKLTAGTYPYRVSVGDLNADGNPDLVVATEDASVRYTLAIFLGAGGGNFQPAISAATGHGPSAIAIRDFNGDGKTDLVVSHCCGATDMTYSQGNGDGTFAPEVHFNGGKNPFAVAVADLNGDGKPDLIVGGTQALSLTPLLNNTTTAATTVNAANTASGTVAAGSIALISGTHLASGTSLTSTAITLQDSGGVSHPCALVGVTPGEVYFLIPASAANGLAAITVQSADGIVSNSTVTIATTAPGIFTTPEGRLLNGLFQVGSAGPLEYTVRADPAHPGQFLPVSISLNPSTSTVHLTLFGTGIRGAPQAQVSARAGEFPLPLQYAGAQGQVDGLDQVSLTLPYSLKGSGDLAITVTAAGQVSNAVHVTIE